MRVLNQRWCVKSSIAKLEPVEPDKCGNSATSWRASLIRHDIPTLYPVEENSSVICTREACFLNRMEDCG